MKNHIKYLVLALLLLGCKNYKSLTTQIDKNKAIPYNQYSQEFQAWEATKNIKLEEAYQIHLGYAVKNQDKIKLKSKEGYPLYYVYDDYYIFSTVTYIHKIGIFNCTGIWVNANTGEVNYVEVDKNQNFHTDPNIWLTSYNGNKHNEE